jgi:hypothetical protein
LSNFVSTELVYGIPSQYTDSLSLFKNATRALRACDGSDRLEHVMAAEVQE